MHSWSASSIFTILSYDHFTIRSYDTLRDFADEVIEKNRQQLTCHEWRASGHLPPSYRQ
jgi:hypothetical protein